MMTSRLVTLMMVKVRCETRCSTMYDDTEDAHCSTEHISRLKAGKLRGGGEGAQLDWGEAAETM